MKSIWENATKTLTNKKSVLINSGARSGARFLLSSVSWQLTARYLGRSPIKSGDISQVGQRSGGGAFFQRQMKEVFWTNNRVYLPFGSDFL